MGKYQDWFDDKNNLYTDKEILLRGWSRDGLTNEQIAKNIGINTKTFYDWKNKSSNLCNVLKETREVVDYEVECALYKNAMNGNVTAQIFWLKNRQPTKWREKQEIIAHNDIENLSTLADMLGFKKGQ